MSLLKPRSHLACTCASIAAQHSPNTSPSLYCWTAPTRQATELVLCLQAHGESHFFGNCQNTLKRIAPHAFPAAFREVSSKQRKSVSLGRLLGYPDTSKPFDAHLITLTLFFYSKQISVFGRFFLYSSKSACYGISEKNC